MEYMVLFFTHSGAIKFERRCKESNIQCELMPVPRTLSSNCSISAGIKTDINIDNFIDDHIEKIFLIKEKENELIYEAE